MTDHELKDDSSKSSSSLVKNDNPSGNNDPQQHQNKDTTMIPAAAHPVHSPSYPASSRAVPWEYPCNSSYQQNNHPSPPVAQPGLPQNPHSIHPNEAQPWKFLVLIKTLIDVFRGGFASLFSKLLGSGQYEVSSRRVIALEIKENEIKQGGDKHENFKVASSVPNSYIQGGGVSQPRVDNVNEGQSQNNDNKMILVSPAAPPVPNHSVAASSSVVPLGYPYNSSYPQNNLPPSTAYPYAAQPGQGESGIKQEHNNNTNKHGLQSFGVFKGSSKDFLAAMNAGKFDQKANENKNEGQDGQEFNTFVITPDNKSEGQDGQEFNTFVTTPDNRT